jgi:hypothetical protein
VGADPEDIVEAGALGVEAAVEDVGAEFLGVADDADDLIEVAFVVAVNAVGGRGREGSKWIAA